MRGVTDRSDDNLRKVLSYRLYQFVFGGKTDNLHDLDFGTGFFKGPPTRSPLLTLVMGNS